MSEITMAQVSDEYSMYQGISNKPKGSDSEEISPYQGAKLINSMLKELGIEKVLPPQMIYTYANKNMIKSHKNEQNKIMIKTSDLLEWFGKYVSKNFSK